MSKPSVHFFRHREALKLCKLLLLLGGLLTPVISHADVRLPHVFGNHMVLQQEKPLTIWGWATPGETVTVKLDQVTQTANANAKGEWKVVLPAMKAAGPYTLVASGSSTVTLDDVMIGEVWLCSGQSNMQLDIASANNGKAEVAQANHPSLRLLVVERRWTPEPQRDLSGTWKVSSPETLSAGGFSAAAYFFGRELNDKLGVAVGLIEADWGGTRIEPWTPPAGFAAVPALQQESENVQQGIPTSPLHQARLSQTLDQYAQWEKAARQALTAESAVPPVPVYPDELRPPHELQQATTLYNGMIHPLAPFAFHGAIWYQGESNVGEGRLYAEHMKALVNGWRTLWGQGDFPFFFVQIAPYKYEGKQEREAELWEAQAIAADTIPNAGMAVINDVGNLGNIHPTDKQTVGHRLALLALGKTYGQKDLVYSGPTFKSMTVADDRLRVTFDHAGGGLASRDGKPLNWFEILDAHEGGFVKAEARIEGDSVVLTAPAVKHPVAMRFAWSGLAEPNLMNAAGLPTGAFRAGERPKSVWSGLNVPEMKDYQLVYDLDLTRLGAAFKYNVDDHWKIQKPFDRIAYLLELEDTHQNTQAIYVSMDAFTADAARIGVPVFGSGAFFQQNVTNLNVYSNVKDIVTGTGLTGGNIEFWPNNYGGGNSAQVPNASSETLDFGDQIFDPADGYGSMQVHNHEARQTLFAINHWREGSRADIGIGNQPTGSPDWTFAKNADSYRTMRLRVLVRGR